MGKAELCYCSFAYSALACFRMGMSGSAFISEQQLVHHRVQPHPGQAATRRG
jgi:hypothetical protein